jgi:bacillithiol biosynthesis deacetylase BshB1
MIEILGIAAHPDDVELSCAGTMLVAKQLGKRTGILDLTRGELSTRGTLETRARETEDASKILKLDWRGNLGLSDGNIEITQENVLKVVRVLREQRPTIVLSTPHSERHPDHEAASELVKRAAFYAGLKKIETTNDNGDEQKPRRPLLVMQFMQTFSFDPTVIIDVTDVWKERMEAVTAYGSQFDKGKDGAQTFLTQSGFYESIEAKARYFGMMIGVEFGEPFWTPQPIGTKNPFSLVTKTIS